MSAEHTDLFKYLGEQMADIEQPELPTYSLEDYILQATDPVDGGQTIQAHIETQPIELHSALLDLYIPLLNFHYMREYHNRETKVRIDGMYEKHDIYAALQMNDMLIELEDKGCVNVGGKMDYFEKHYYTDQATGLRRPILSLCMHSGAFKREDGDGGVLVGMPNNVTIPVTAIAHYSIKEPA